MSETIIGIGVFLDSTENTGTVLTGLFDGSATNSGTTTNASFSGSASNTGTVIEQASFTDTAINTGTVAVAEFTGSASNTGTVTEAASFADTTTNSGTISGTATFSGSAENDGGTVAGPVVFTGTAVNNGTVAEAIFLGSSQNGGTVTLSAVFAENAGNLGTGLIQGNAVFADNTVNAGTIQGNAEIAATANGEQGTVAGSVTTYTQPDGAFAYGYFSGGSKTAPASYATVVYQVGSFWYKYDASGNGALATGNYSDGTSMFTFANGVKGAAYVPPSSAITLGGVEYYYSSNASFGNGTVLYSDSNLTSIVSPGGAAGWFTDRNNDSIDEYVYVRSNGIHIQSRPSSANYDLVFIGQYNNTDWTDINNWFEPNGTTPAGRTPNSSDTVLVTTSITVNNMEVDTVLLWGTNQVELYAPNGGYMIGHVRAYGATRIRNVDIYGVTETFNNSWAGDSVLHGVLIQDDNSTNNGNVPGNTGRVQLVNGLYYENYALYTGTKSYDDDGYGNATTSFTYVNGVETSRNI
jgi:hypothetical protein